MLYEVITISHKDYLDYREPLAFDALCDSLGQVFIDFLELFSRITSYNVCYTKLLRCPISDL